MSAQAIDPETRTSPPSGALGASFLAHVELGAPLEVAVADGDMFVSDPHATVSMAAANIAETLVCARVMRLP
jgi:hypothetical protein